MTSSLDHAPCGFVSFTDDGVIVEVNKMLADTVGYSKPELVGRNLETIFTIASKIFYSTHLFPLIKLHGSAQEIFITLKTKDGSAIPVLANATREHQQAHHINYAVFMPVHRRQKFEDEIIAAKKDAEQGVLENRKISELSRQLEDSIQSSDKHYTQLTIINRNLIEFSKVVSHDLQEPIRKLRVYIDKFLQADSEQVNPSLQSTVSKMLKAIGRVQALTLGLSKFLQVGDNLEAIPANLNELVLNAKTLAELESDFQAWEFERSELPEIECYPAQIELLFYHIMMNSIQNRHPDRVLTFKISYTLIKENAYQSNSDKYRYTEHVKLQLADNGSGIDPLLKESIFSLFKKANVNTEGLGLGLSFAKRIVEYHSGIIDIESKKGEGTTVNILLPVKQD